MKRPEVIARQEKSKGQPKPKVGQPVMPSFRSVAARTLIAAGFFYFMLALVFKDTPAQALFQTGLLTVIMVPLTMLLDRLTYKRKMKRWEAQRSDKA